MITMEIVTEAQLLEKTLNTGGKKEIVYNSDGFDCIENIQHNSYQTHIKEVELSLNQTIQLK